MKQKVLWFSRHAMTEEQKNSLGDVEINQINKTIHSAKELKAEIEANDIIAIVAPIELQREFLELAGDKPVITAVNDRVLVPQQDGTEDKLEFHFRKWERLINFHTANLRPTKSLGVREPRVWLSETKRKTPECSGVSFFRAGNSNSLTNAFHICVYVHLCVVPRYIASQHPWKQSQSLLQNTKETTAGHFRRSVFLLSGRIPGVHELLWKAASLSCGRYR